MNPIVSTGPVVQCAETDDASIKATILVVDDSTTAIAFMKESLEGVDADIMVAHNGKEALIAALRYELAVILLDVEMPGMNGYQLAKYLRKEKKTQNIPIVFITGNTEPEQQFLGYEVGAVDFHGKPIDPIIVASKVKVFVELFRQRKKSELFSEKLKAELLRSQEISSELRFVYSAVEEATEAILLLDRDGYPLFVNRAFVEVSGYTIEALKEISVKDYLSVELITSSCDDIELLNYRVDSRLITRDGGEVLMQIGSSAIVDDCKRIMGQSLVFTDMTERHSFEEKRREMEDQLRQSQKMKAIGGLAAGVAHEINTPSQFVGDNIRFIQESIKDYHDLLDGFQALIDSVKPECFEVGALDRIRALCEDKDIGFLREEVPNALAQSLDGVVRISSIVKAMKEFSHPSSGQMSPMNLNDAIKNTVTIARNEWKYVADVEMDLDADLPSVMCFPGEINQVILNVLVNAAHAIEDRLREKAETKGIINISTSSRTQWVEVAISDSGTGMVREIQEKIFEPFYTTKEVGRGTGQGLSIAYDVIHNKHSGQILCESKVGVGTTFRIRLMRK